MAASSCSCLASRSASILATWAITSFFFFLSPLGTPCFNFWISAAIEIQHIARFSFSELAIKDLNGCISKFNNSKADCKLSMLSIHLLMLPN